MIFTANIRVVEAQTIRIYSDEEIAQSVIESQKPGSRMRKLKNPAPNGPHYEGTMLTKTLKKGKSTNFEVDDFTSFKSFVALSPGDYVVDLLVECFKSDDGKVGQYVQILKVLKAKPQAA